MNIPNDAISRFEEIPYLRFGHFPTPVEELPRLREALGGGPRIFIKRDDYSGAGFGGNKVRKLEYVLADAKAGGVEIAITTGGEKSNHARVTASLCARLGIRCILVLNPAAVSYQGMKPASLLVDELVGAVIHPVSHRDQRRPAMEALARKLRSEGRKVVISPLGASIPLGAIGFVRAVQETRPQLERTGVNFNYLFHCSSSGGTQAGLVAGCRLFGLHGVKVIGVSPDDSSDAISTEVYRIIRGIAGMLGLPEGSLDEELTVLDDYVGDGYGISTPESDAAIELVAKTEGIVLDPVYTAKAMAGLIDWITKGKLKETDNVLFWHTGGQLALFYSPE